MYVIENLNSSSYSGGKVLIYSGTRVPVATRFSAEVFDLINEGMICDSLENKHSTSYPWSSGGQINEDFIFCGGGTTLPNKKCQKSLARIALVHASII